MTLRTAVPTDRHIPTLHVIVSCKSRKTLPAAPELHFSSIPAEPLESRMRRWVTTLESSAAALRSAGDLYAGEHWRAIRKIGSTSCDGWQTKVWVASAGYGLVELTTKLKSYSATFIKSHHESVLPNNAQYSASDWWRELAKWQPEPGASRQVTDVAALAKATGGFVLLALSEPYASAMAQDITTASRVAGDRLGVISAGLSGSKLRRALLPQGFEAVMLPAESRLKNAAELRGAMQGLNARIAARAVCEQTRWFPSRLKLEALMREWLASAPTSVHYDRERLSDLDVKRYIKEQIANNSSLSKSKALRALRDSGRACEQSRFGLLFAGVAASTGAKSRAPRNGVGK